MNWKKELVKILSKEFSRIREVNPRFSVRGFSKKLGISPTLLSQILRSSEGWSLSKERAAIIIDKLSISTEEKNFLLNGIGMPVNRNRRPLETKAYDILTDYTYAAILCCHNLPKAERDPLSISNRLGIPVSSVEDRIKILIEKRLLQVADDNTVESNPNFWLAGDGPSNALVKKHHENNLKMAMDALEKLSTEERDFSSMMFVGNLSKINEIRREIRIFHEKIMSLTNPSGEDEDIFQFSVSLFPVRSLKEGIAI